MSRMRSPVTDPQVGLAMGRRLASVTQHGRPGDVDVPFGLPSVTGMSRPGDVDAPGALTMRRRLASVRRHGRPGDVDARVGPRVVGEGSR